MKKLKDLLITILILTIISFVFLLTIISTANNKTQYLKNLDYQVQINENGYMHVIETWDIDVSNTNTLFKTFDLTNKYGKITDVEVRDLQNRKQFEQINEEMYHLPKDKFYALKLNSKEFEIAFGIGMDTSSGNRKIQISYSVENVVTDYKDCQEIYWQFLGEGKNAIPAKKVTGKFILPKSMSNSENLKVWGHGQLNGEIKKTSNSEVKFEVNNLKPMAMLEIRIATVDKIFKVDNTKVKEYNYLNTMLQEENRWANEANIQAEGARVIICTIGIIYIILMLIEVIQVRKCLKINKKGNDGIIKNEIKYFRDIPREKTSTPAEAGYLYKFERTRLNSRNSTIRYSFCNNIRFML